MFWVKKVECNKKILDIFLQLVLTAFVPTYALWHTSIKLFFVCFLWCKLFFICPMPYGISYCFFMNSVNWKEELGVFAYCNITGQPITFALLIVAGHSPLFIERLNASYHTDTNITLIRVLYFLKNKSITLEHGN